MKIRAPLSLLIELKDCYSFLHSFHFIQLFSLYSFHFIHFISLLSMSLVFFSKTHSTSVNFNWSHAWILLNFYSLVGFVVQMPVIINCILPFDSIISKCGDYLCLFRRYFQITLTPRLILSRGLINKKYVLILIRHDFCLKWFGCIILKY